MRGRYASFRKAQQIADEFDVVTLSQAARDLEPSWNIPPTAPVRIIVARPATAEERPATAAERSATGEGRGEAAEPVRAMHAARWGLVPPWADSFSMGARMFNARSETAATKPSFRKPFSTSRCLVVADGYYEWHTSETSEKTPDDICQTHRETMALAGLYSWRPNPRQHT